MIDWLRRVFATGGEAPEPYGPEARVREVRAVLEELAPLVALDGGRIELVGVDEQGWVEVELRGACAACSASSTTLHDALAPRLRAVAPWFAGIRAR